MKKKKYLSPTIFFYLLLISCNKQETETTLRAICTNVLDNWEINSNSYHSGIQKQNDIFFPTNDIGYSAGNAGSIMKTINGGENWEVLEFYYLPEVGINTSSL